MNDRITDDEFKNILIEHAIIETDLDEINISDEHVFSERHNQNMTNYFESLRKNDINQATSNPMFFNKHKRYKLVASILIILLVGGIVIGPNSIISYAKQMVTVVVEVFEKYSIITFDDGASEDTAAISPPLFDSKEFKLVDSIKLDLYIEYRYENSKEKYIIIGMSENNNINHFIDTENTEIQKRDLNGITYYYYTKNNNIFVYYLRDNVVYSIESNLDVEALFDEIYPKIDHPYTQEYIVGMGNIKGNVDIDKYIKTDSRFEIGADKDGYAVFKDPIAAFEVLMDKYSSGISLIEKEYNLSPLTHYNCDLYKVLGCQCESGTEEERKAAKFVSEFLDIYENSFSFFK